MRDSETADPDIADVSAVCPRGSFQRMIKCVTKLSAQNARRHLSVLFSYVCALLTAHSNHAAFDHYAALRTVGRQLPTKYHDALMSRAKSFISFLFMNTKDGHHLIHPSAEVAIALLMPAVVSTVCVQAFWYLLFIQRTCKTTGA